MTAPRLILTLQKVIMINHCIKYIVCIIAAIKFKSESGIKDYFSKYFHTIKVLIFM